MLQQQQFQAAVQARQRRAQLVGDHRDEIALQLVELLQLLVLLFQLPVSFAQGVRPLFHLLFQLFIQVFQLPVQRLQVAVTLLDGGLLAFLVA